MLFSTGPFLCEYDPRAIPSGVSCERFELECSDAFRAMAPQAQIRFQHSSCCGIRRQGDSEPSIYLEYSLYCVVCNSAEWMQPWKCFPRTHD